MSKGPLLSAQEYHDLLKAVPVGIGALSEDQRLLHYNRALARFLGLEESGNRPPELAAFLPPEEWKRWSERFRELFAGEREDLRETFGFRRPSGEERWAEVYAARPAPAAGNGTRWVPILFQDITAARRTEEDLRRQADRTRKILQTTMEGYVLADTHGRIVDVNPAYCELTGFSRDELLSMTIYDLEAHFTPQEIAEKIREMVSKRWDRFETRHRRKDGGVVELEVSVFVTDWDREQLVAAFMRDIGEKRRAEEALRQAQKVQAIGRFAGEIAHDFNNLLQVLLGELDTLRLRDEDKERRDEGLRRMETEVRRGAAMARQLLLLARRDISRREVADLNAVLRGLAELLRRLVRDNIEVRFEYAPQPVPVEVDQGQIEQVILNLAANSSDAMPEGGVLTFRIASAPGWAILEVQDTGHGMSDGVRERIFEPFFSTKGPERGAGLGLAVVQRVVEEHGGRIDLQSAEGKGTTFRIRLPVAEGRLAPPPEPAPKPRDRIPRGTGRILVVEDEDMVRHLLEESLTLLGYEVRAVRNAEEAAALPETERFDLLIADLMLPGRNGVQLARDLRRRMPGLKALYISGYTEDEEIEEQLERGTERFLSKPFGIRALAEEVRSILSEGAGRDPER